MWRPSKTRLAISGIWQALSNADEHRLTVLSAVFFASGASALLFETLWFRLAGLAFGNSVWASATVLASFMGGLALGNALAARTRSKRPLRFYAALEVAIGATGLTLVLLLPVLTRILAPILRLALDRPLLLNALRLSFAGVLMIIPTTAMGATLPVLIRALSRDDERFGSRLGMLYGWNTAGAVAGALAGELLLIEAFGLRGTGVVAALLNLGAATVAFRLPVEDSRPRLSDASGQARSPVLHWKPLIAAFVSGATFLALEVVWFRFLLLFTDGTSLAFAIMLAAVLIGISLGSLIASQFTRGDVATIAFACGAATILCFAGFAPGAAPGRFTTAIALRDATVSLRLMLLTSIGSGMLFTFIGRDVQRRLGDETRSTALLTFANTTGAMIGALAAGFVLLPALGMEKSFFVLAFCYGVIAILMFNRRAIIAAVVFAACLAMFPFGVVNRTFIPLITEDYRKANEQIIATREGLTETDIYLRRNLWGQPYTYRLMTNGVSMSGTTLLGLRYMSLFAELPMALNPDASRALLISYGVGTTAKALTDTPSLRSIDVVDISRDVLIMSRLRHFEGGHPLDDPRVHVHIEDGRFFLLTTPQKFDLITAEPPPPKNALIVNLYSREYFKLIRDRLVDGGLATYWLPIYQFRAREGKAVIKAFCDVFADCSLWSGGGPEMILLGSRNVRAVSASAFEQQWREPAASRRLSSIGVESPELLGSLFIADAPWLRQFTADTPPLVDDFPLRLSPRPVDELPAEFLPLFDIRASQRRFAESRWIAQVWPPQLRQRSIDAFVYRYFTDHHLRTQEIVLPGAAYTLTHTAYRSLPAILLGSDSRQQAIASSTASLNPEVVWAKGVQALSERRYADAANLLGAASRSRPTQVEWAQEAALARQMTASQH